ncbi:hypothetical protein MATL_G00216810 [Megalops atlanticus]|uniref:Uncharacterized protein n=1 Tax=Megalops atlanticus TaxID=7932 RepID=A0A9D3PGU8_MEGAT|nr:hypothetical protein MATL_G00216810 [Megalops atlanticus]
MVCSWRLTEIGCCCKTGDKVTTLSTAEKERAARERSEERGGRKKGQVLLIGPLPPRAPPQESSIPHPFPPSRFHPPSV